ncbi:MAG: hypothetical protein Q8P12_05880, partial [bacterium]|nr:hypothetical protein [bacterium]
TASPELHVYTISSPSNPVFAGGFEAGNHVNGVYVFEGRAFLATAGSGKQLIVADVSNPASIAELGSFETPTAGAPGQAVFYGGGIVHLTTRDNPNELAEYYLLEASDPTDISLFGGFNVSSRTNAIEAAIGFSILATEKSGEQLMIVDTANPSSLTKAFSLALEGSAHGVALNGCYAYFVSADDSEEVKAVTPE